MRCEMWDVGCVNHSHSAERQAHSEKAWSMGSSSKFENSAETNQKIWNLEPRFIAAIWRLQRFQLFFYSSHALRSALCAMRQPIRNPQSINNLSLRGGHCRYGLFSDRLFRQFLYSGGHGCGRWWEGLADENEDRRPRGCKEFPG